MTEDDPARLDLALADTERGEFERAEQLLARGAALVPQWAEALEAARWRAGFDDAVLPTHEALEAWIDAPADTRRAAARACQVLVYDRITSFDRAAATAAIELHAKLAGTDDPEQSMHVELERAWLSIADDGVQAARVLHGLAKTAASRQAASLLVETTALRALALARDTDLAKAVTVARRACRMARTESLPQPEYLAGVVLSRLRRLSGRPYLATRILSGLRHYAPPMWWPWIEWEAAMAGGSVDAVADTPAGHAQVAIQAAAAGDATGFHDGCEAMLRRVRGWAPLQRDAQALRAAIDPEAPLPRGSGLSAWRDGASVEIPRGLEALAGPAATVAYVDIGPERPARRRLAVGAALADAVRLDPPSGRPGRAETLLAVVALAGSEGLPIGAAFEAVYGFPYAPSTHDDAFGVMLHRARKRLGDLGELVRIDTIVRLTPRVRLLVPDPRCASQTPAIVLRLLAEGGGLRAKDIAGPLGIPLRTVQHWLRDLVEIGACESERSGREVLYRMEDTTFQEPTRVRGR